MSKKNFVFLILSAVIVFTIFFVYRKNSIKDDNITKANTNVVNTKDDNITKGNTNVVNTLEEKSNIKKWSELNNLEDIGENMIINNSIGEFFLTYGSTPKTNGFSLKFSKFTGVHHYVSINTENECDVVISYKNSAPEDDFKVFIISSSGELVELMKESVTEKATYSLSKGENIIALIGYKATGEFEIYIEPQEGVELLQID